MPPRNVKKARTAAPVTRSRRGTAAANAVAAAVTTATRGARRQAQRPPQHTSAEVAAWVDAHDALLDRAEQHPLTVDELLADKLQHPTFTRSGSGHTATAAQAFDWSALREALTRRQADSPRWYMQLREEDLLLGPDGLEGVTVDCVVVAEAHAPTLSPAEYIVKVHWPYSDAEDNAPERILPIAQQDMCWRRVVRDDGVDINAYVLQKRSDTTRSSRAAAATTAATSTASMFGFGATAVSPPSSSAAPVDAAAAAAAAAPANTTSVSAFSFGFGAPASSSTTAATTASTFAPATAAVTSAGETAAAPSVFGFGAPAPATTTTTHDSNSSKEAESGAVTVQPLKCSEVLFALWTRERLRSMAKELRSGSRIVREGFALHSGEDSSNNGGGGASSAIATIKLVMQNDRTDRVRDVVRQLLLNRVFAKTDAQARSIDAWLEQCPVYDATLTTALQRFRERYVRELADNSPAFAAVYERNAPAMEAELQRIVGVRERAARAELDAIADIVARLDAGTLAEKTQFRLLKYYAKNDVLPFRPYGKISGISEAGETVDACEPPAHVNVNPFLAHAK